MNAQIATSGHIAFKGKVCPVCNAKDSIVYWKNTGIQSRLDNSVREVSARCRPKCSKCGTVFKRGTKYDVIR